MSEKAYAFLVGIMIGWASIIILTWFHPMTTFACKEAVAHGHAEYYLDKDNQRQWRWLEPKGDR